MISKANLQATFSKNSGLAEILLAEAGAEIFSCSGRVFADCFTELSYESAMSLVENCALGHLAQMSTTIDAAEVFRVDNGCSVAAAIHACDAPSAFLRFLSRSWDDSGADVHFFLAPDCSDAVPRRLTISSDYKIVVKTYGGVRYRARLVL